MHSSSIRKIFLTCSVIFGTALGAVAERELHVVGLYEGENGGTSAKVHVNREGQSVTLFLSAYDAVHWQVSVSAGTTIERVFLNGYYRQTLTGLPATVPVISSSYEEGSRYLWIGYDLNSSAFLRSVPRIEDLTGQRIASFHGGYQPLPAGFVIDSVQDDPRLSSDYPQPVPLSQLPDIEFDVATFEGRLTIRRYGLDGPEDGGPLLGSGAIVNADASGRFYYGGDNGLVEINSETGAVREIPMLAEIEREGWQMGTAFDRKRNLALLVTLAGEGFLYGYSPAENQWPLRTSMANRDFDCIVYHDADDSLYAVTTSHEDSVHAKIVQLTAEGTFLKEIPIPILPFNIGPSGHRAELVSAGKYLVLLLAPGRMSYPDALPESRIYLIDPSTSEVWLTFRQQGPPNQRPEVALELPRGGAAVPPGSTVRFAAHAIDRDGTVASVEFFVNDHSIGLGTRDPARGLFVVDWTAPDSGRHTVVAKATDNDGATGVSAALTMVVDRPPTISINAPANGTTVELGASVVLSATAHDPDGSIASVVFHVNGAVRPATRVPETDTYTTTWQANSAGTFNIQAVARDDLGAFGESERIQVIVQGSPGGSVTTTRFLPPFYVPERRVTVVITAVPSADSSDYFVVERPPAGWAVSRVSRGGEYDAITGTITFGPFTSSRPRVFSYRLIPPIGTTGPQQFSGNTIINGVPTPIGGASVINSRIRLRPELPPILRQGYE